MPNVSAALFIAKVLDKQSVHKKRVLDVGSCDYNGSVASLIKSWGPSEYIGVDIHAGPGVDIVCGAEELVKQFGKESFDIVLSVEMLEHAKNWRESINNIKDIIKPGGILAITTRSLGYPCHGFPFDFWRYQEEDFRKIFSEFEIKVLEGDSIEPGIFIHALKKTNTPSASLEDIELYSIPLNRRIKILPDNYEADSYFKKLKLKQLLKKYGSNIFLGSGRILSKVLRIK